jgi:hypothetical protein
MLRLCWRGDAEGEVEAMALGGAERDMRNKYERSEKAVCK